MIAEPDRFIDDFTDAGADMLSVHVEVTPHLHRTIAHIKSRGVKAGAVINPSTPVSTLTDIAGDLDFVLVMSVNPGFGGQAFIRHSVDKVRRVREMFDRIGSRADGIDGGIDQMTAAEVMAAGASIRGRSAIFNYQMPKRRRAHPVAAVASREHDHRSDVWQRHTGIRRSEFAFAAETDQMGGCPPAFWVVQVARVEWLRQEGGAIEMEHDGTALPVIEAHCIPPTARYDDGSVRHALRC
jgi:hypothetical protein